MMFRRGAEAMLEMPIEVLRNHIRNLRLKIEIDPASPRRLIRRPGSGYALVAPEVPAGSVEPGEGSSS